MDQAWPAAGATPARVTNMQGPSRIRLFTGWIRGLGLAAGFLVFPFALMLSSVRSLPVVVLGAVTFAAGVLALLLVVALAVTGRREATPNAALVIAGLTPSQPTRVQLRHLATLPRLSPAAAVGSFLQEARECSAGQAEPWSRKLVRGELIEGMVSRLQLAQRAAARRFWRRAALWFAVVLGVPASLLAVWSGLPWFLVGFATLFFAGAALSDLLPRRIWLAWSAYVAWGELLAGFFRPNEPITVDRGPPRFTRAYL